MTAMVPLSLTCTEWNVGWDYCGDGWDGPVRLAIFKHVPRTPTADNPLRFETVYAINCLCDSARQAHDIAVELGYCRAVN